MIKFNNTSSCDQEEDPNSRNVNHSNNNPTASRAGSSSSGFRNPRIVRVARNYGGKDRHSKVWTVKGLKDRRIRLSIPTATELYELQDKLGLSQPSKVIDWLLDVTKDDINNLPPLQMTLEDFNQFHQSFNSAHEISFPPVFFNSPNYDHQRTKGKEVFAGVYNESQPSNIDLSLSRFGNQFDTYASSLNNSQSNVPIISPSFCPQYPHDFLHNHTFLTANSPNTPPVPLNLNDKQARLLFGLHMNNSKAASTSESNDTA